MEYCIGFVIGLFCAGIITILIVLYDSTCPVGGKHTWKHSEPKPWYGHDLLTDKPCVVAVVTKQCTKCGKYERYEL